MFRVSFNPIRNNKKSRAGYNFRTLSINETTFHSTNKYKPSQSHFNYSTITSNQTIDNTADLQKRDEKPYEYNTELDFSNGKLAYLNRTNFELFRSFIVFQMCRRKIFLKSASLLLSIYEEKEAGTFAQTRNQFLQPILSKLIKKTIFTQFIGGENEKEIIATTTFLHNLSVSSLLDYSIESPALSPKSNTPKTTLPPSEPVQSSISPSTPSSCKNLNLISRKKKDQKIVKGPQPACSDYFYSFDSEAYFDKNADDKIKSIGESAVCNTNTVPFIAIKMSGVMGADYLKEFSNNLDVMERDFNSFKDKKDLNSDEFFEYLTQFHRLELTKEDSNLFFNQLLKRDPSFDPSQGTINFLTFIDYFDLQADLVFTPTEEYNKNTKDKYKKMFRSVNFPLRAGNESNYALFQSHYPRLLKICKIASHLNVRVLMDAEQTYLQTSINLLTLKLEEMFNKETAIVYNTYQCYLKITPSRLHQSYERATRLGYKMGAKMVRGAYLASEKKEFDHLFCSSLEETHKTYNDSIPYLFDRLIKNDNVQIVFATHNQDSVVKVLEHFKEYRVDPKENKIFFANLLGMSDNLTFILAQNKYPAMKVVPYGPLPVVLPYLIRRAQENSAVLINTRNESAILFKELKRRFVSSLFISKENTK